MPTASEVFAQIHAQQQSGDNSPFDTVRRHYMNELHNETGRNLILYSTAWTQEQSGNTSLSIDESDLRAFMEVIHGLSQDDLDIILHSPGGSPVATEQIVEYVRTKFDDVRIFIPQAAMSAATLMCCAADTIVMGDHSSLGPIDPQMTMQTNGGRQTTAAHAILEQFEKAKGDIKANADLLPWLPILRQYAPGLLAECDDAVALSTELAKEWAHEYMHEGKPDAERERKSEAMSEFLSDREMFKSHGRRINREKASANGFDVTRLEDNDREQDLVLSIFHATMHAHESTPLQKVVENHMGRNVLRVNASSQQQPTNNPQSQDTPTAEGKSLQPDDEL